MNRRKRKARVISEDMRSNRLVQFIPGGSYWLTPDGRLLTGVHSRMASETIRAKLIDHARRAVNASGEWVL